MSNKLVEIPFEQWPKLRDLYKEHKNRASCYNTIQTFINWINKEPKMPIKVYSLNGEWEVDGTYVAEILDKELFCNTLSDDRIRLLDALKCFDLSEIRYIGGFQDRILPAVEKYFLLSGFEKEQYRVDGTVWYTISREEALKFDTEPPQNLTVKKLNECNAEQVNRIWPHRSDGSVKFVKTLINLNESVGIFEDDKLVAWCLMLPLGALGLLQVEDSHKRQCLGQLAVRCMSKLLAQNGLEVSAPVVFGNVASRSMFKKLGFHIVDKVYWASKV